MTCSRCKYHWCWNCSGPNNHSENKRGCLWKVTSAYTGLTGGSSDCAGEGLAGGNLGWNIFKIIVLCLTVPLVLFFGPFVYINFLAVDCMFGECGDCGECLCRILAYLAVVLPLAIGLGAALGGLCLGLGSILILPI